MDRNELLTRIRQGRQQWEALLAQVSRSQLSEPALSNDWSVKDLVGHIGFWERRVVDRYRALQGNELPDPELDGLSETETNARIYARNRERPLENVLQDEDSAYQALLELSESAPEADLFTAGRFAWTGIDPFANWIAGNSYEHYAEHSPDVLAWLKTL